MCVSVLVDFGCWALTVTYQEILPLHVPQLFDWLRIYHGILQYVRNVDFPAPMFPSTAIVSGCRWSRELLMARSSNGKKGPYHRLETFSCFCSSRATLLNDCEL